MERRRRRSGFGTAAAVICCGLILGGCGARSQEEYEEVRPSVGRIRLAITTTGTVEPQNRLEMKPPIGGRIEEILVKEGDRVKAGQTLVWMSSTDRAALLDAARTQGAEAVAYWKEVYRPTPLMAPIDGEVIVRAMEPGQTVSTSDAVLVLSDRLIVQAQVDETDIGRVKVGQDAVVSLDAYPKVKINGEVAHKSYESKVMSNVTIYEVDIIPEEVPDFFRSGMSAVVEIVEESRKGVLRLPVEAVTKGAEGRVVLISQGAGKNRVVRPVKVGLADDRYIEIISGVGKDDVVLVPRGKSIPRSRRAGTSPLMPSRPSERSGRSRQQS